MIYKILLLLFLCLNSWSTFAQDHQATIGLSISYDLLHNTSNNTERSITSGQTFGIEFSETKSNLGYRVGASASIIKDQDLLNYLNIIIGPSQLPVFPSIANLIVIDFHLSGQYIYYRSETIDLYGNLGVLLTSGHYKNEDYTKYTRRQEQMPYQSLSLRGLLGGGVIYKLTSRIQLDLSFQRKFRLYTFDDHYIRPFNSFNFQTKIARTF